MKLNLPYNFPYAIIIYIRFMGVFRKFFSIYCIIVFLVFMLLLFPFVIFASFFGKVKGGNMVYKICGLWADLAFFFWGIGHKYIYEAPKRDTAVFIFNHISYLDAAILVKAFRKRPVRVLGKAEMAQVPIFGFIYKNAVVMVNRSSPEARYQSLQLLKQIVRKGISIIIAPEGTFNVTNKPLKEFYNGAFEVAIETQTPVQPVLFLDAYDRMHYQSIFTLNPGKCRTVFLEPIPVNGYTLQDVQKLKTLAFEKMETALIKYKAGWIKT